jgi:hypothetical protein
MGRGVCRVLINKFTSPPHPLPWSSAEKFTFNNLKQIASVILPVQNTRGLTHENKNKTKIEQKSRGNVKTVAVWIISIFSFPVFFQGVNEKTAIEIIRYDNNKRPPAFYHKGLKDNLMTKLPFVDPRGYWHST